MKVFIGVGHGGSDPGAVANGVKEKELNLQLALACRDELSRHGIEVKLSRTKDENDPISEEIRECNAFGPDLAVDIHNNAGGGNGAEVFYHYKGGKSKTLAVNILDEIVELGQNSRGVKVKKNSKGQDAFGFIRETSAPAVIVEVCFVDNASDLKFLATARDRERAGRAIAHGVLKTLGVEIQSEKLYRVCVGAYRYKVSAETMQKKLKAAGFDSVIVKDE